MSSVGGPAGATGGGGISTGMVPSGQTGGLPSAGTQNAALAQPGAPGSLPQGPPSAAPVGSTNAVAGGGLNITGAGGTALPPSGNSGSGIGTGGATKRKEIYKYEAPWTVYSMNWSVRPDKRFRLALGSFVEEYNNKVRKRAFIGMELSVTCWRGIYKN